jgi:hypothetical protein
MSVVLLTEPFSNGGGGTGTVTSVDVVGGSTGLTTTGGPITTSGTITLGGTLSVGSGGTGASTLTGILKGTGTTPITIATAGTDYQAPITLTTTGTSGAATFIGNTLNIPQYSGGGGGSGTVTTVSVVSANGLAGTVANATTTPAITLSTSITGVLKGNGTAISAAVANTDYQSPITLTTTGSSGAATFNGTTLNIPQYTGGGGGGGPILESQIVISQNYTLTSNTNGFSVSPVTVATGYAVTVPTGQVWVIWNT